MSTYPIAMPMTGASLQQFEPQRVDYLAPEAGGRIGGVTAGNPLWYAVWQIGTIGARRSDLWRAFLTRLRGSQRTFLGFDIARPFPFAYPAGFSGLTRAGGGAFDGSATSWSQTINSDGDALLTLNGLPAGLAIAVGDYTGFKWDASGSPIGTFDRRTLARAIEDATANGSGQVTFRVEPPVPTLVVPSTATAHLNNPACIMRQVVSATDIGPIDRRLAITNGKFTAVQDLRA